MRLFLAILVLFATSCNRVSNIVNRDELECGAENSNDSGRLIRLFNDSGRIESPQGIEVRGEDGQSFISMLTSKGCLKVPQGFNQKLIVSRPATNEGFILFSDHVVDQTHISMLLKGFRYKAISSMCQGVVSTNAKQIQWPLDLQGQDASAFAYRLRITGPGMSIDLSRIGNSELSSEHIDVSPIPDGTYAMDIQVRQLFSQDKLESQFSCKLIIDRQAPLVSLDRQLIRLDGEETPILQAGPGETITIQTKSIGSADQIFACLQPIGNPASLCEYSEAVGGIVTAPGRGTWVLRLFAKDSAGNSGEVVERTLQIFDSSLVAVNRSYVEQANLAKQAGSYVSALVSSVKAYEKMQSLSSSSERKSVFAEVRKVLAESSTLPVEELSRKQQQNDSVTALGMIQQDGKAKLIQSSQGVIEIVETTGHVESHFDLKEVLNTTYMRMNQRFCDSSGRLVATSPQSAVIYDQGVFQKKVEFLENQNVWTTPEISKDCRYLTVAIDSGKQLIYEVSSGQKFVITSSRFAIESTWGEPGSQKVLISKYGLPFSIVDLPADKITDASALTGIQDIAEVKQSEDNSLGIRSADNTLHLLNSQGKETVSIPDVIRFDASAVPGEFIVVLVSTTIRLISSQDGLVKSELSVGTGNFSYLNADKDFVLALPAGGNALKVWTRAGGNYDEIYNKGDSITQVWLSRLGYFHVTSFLYSKLFKPSGSIVPQYKPNMNFAVGLQFSADGNHLIFKEQQSTKKDGFDWVEHNLVSWDYGQNQSQTFTIDGAMTFNSNVPYQPGYSALSRDLETYSESGTTYTVAIVKRAGIAVYDASDLKTPIREFRMRERGRLLENWFLDLSVHPGHQWAAAASQDGSVYIFDLADGQIVSSARLLDSVAGGFEEYPIALSFDPTGKILYVTDVNGNLLRYDVQADASLVFKQKIALAGKDLQISPDGQRIAVVGNKAELNIYNQDLILQKQYDLGGGSFEIGQSLAFSPDGTKVYVGVYPGYWNEIDLLRNTQFKVKYGTSAAAGGNMIVNPQGDKIAFMSGSFVRVIDLDIQQMYKNICTWLKPRLPFIPDLNDEERALCSITTKALQSP